MEKISKSDWKQLVKGKEDFLKILRDLNQFYKNKAKTVNLNLNEFREEITFTKARNLRIYILKYAQFEYLVCVEIRKDKQIRRESWIHIDGVSYEKEVLKKSGVNDHPIFDALSMTELFEKASPTKFQLEENLE
jgi:hypothetical protein